VNKTMAAAVVARAFAGRLGSLCAVLVLILSQKCPLADSPACARASSASLFPEAKVRLGGQ